MADLVMTTTMAHAQQQQWRRDVLDVLRTPLTGQAVLIPIGKYAFVQGTLRPSPAQVSGDDANETTEGDSERVEYVHNNGGKESVTRQQARIKLQAELDALTTGVMTTTARSATNKQTRNESTTLIPTKPIVNDDDDDTDHSLLSPAYFDIHEEFDAAGQQTFGQAVNVAKHLQLWQQQQQPPSIHEGQNGTSLHGRRRPEDHPTTTSRNASSSEYGELVPVAPELPHKNLNDHDYHVLSARLDELCRLEEEQQQRPHASHDPSRVNQRARLQKKTATSHTTTKSGGWSKGFLKNTNKYLVKEPNPPNSTRRVPDPSTNISTAESLVAQREDTVSTTTADTARPKAVNFSPALDTVQTIPRIGERSIRDITRPASKPIKSIPSSPSPPPSPPIYPIPHSFIDEKVLAESVYERPVHHPLPAAGHSVTHHSTTTFATPTTTSDTPLSRFARERQLREN